ncbi:MAG: DUF2029 domain-containing protein [Sphingomonadales bacterium]|nr:DUF2029 domain-containing protein [Sphingomonadales bacterium]
MMAIRQAGKPWPKIEGLLAATIIGGIFYCAIHVARNGYLPAPFFYEPSDTFADWFNTAYWSRKTGAYDTWGTIYPPISFLFVRLFSIGACYPEIRPFDPSAGLDARDCDWLALTAMPAIFAINLVLTFVMLRKLDPLTAVPRTICVALGMPMLNALERGNLLMIAYTCTILAVGPFLKSARLRWIFAGLAVNFKVYLIGTFVALLLRKRWLWVEGFLISTVVIYLISLAMFGYGTPFEIIDNIRLFSQGAPSQILDAWHSMTYSALLSVIEVGAFPLTSIIGSRSVEFLEFWLPVILRLTQVSILLAAAVIWYRPELFNSYRAISLGTLMSLISAESGMYTQIFFMIFIMTEPWKGFGRKWAICACYVLSMPFDIAIDHLPEVPRNTYFTDSVTMISFDISIGPLVRPLLIMSVAWAISLVTIAELWRSGLVPFKKDQTIDKSKETVLAQA